ncbi:MAG: response regulator transcription factor [Pyrinomonadaceae bacterium]
MRETNSNSKILMIDDDLKLCRLVGEYLTPFGFEVIARHTGNEGVDAVRDKQYDAVILDVMLPGIDGFEVLRQIRAISDVPVLMLTALGDEADRIVGLEIGADDYLPKTFSTRELLARLRAATRRASISGKPPESGDEVAAGDVIMNSATRIAKQAGSPLDLTALEFDLLNCLVRSAGRVLNRDQILDEIAGREYDVFDRSIDVHISSLRRKLGDDFKSPRYIRTLRSVGYMFVAQGSEGAEC